MKKNTYIRLFKFIRPRWLPYVTGIVGISFVNLSFNLVFAVGLKMLTNAILGHNLTQLTKNSISMAVYLGILMVAEPVFFYMFASTTRSTTGDVRQALFNHIQKLPVRYIEDRHTGDYISRLLNDIQAAENAFGWNVMLPISSIVTGIGAGIYIFGTSPILGAVAVGIGIIGMIANASFMKPIRKMSKKAQESISRYTQRISDMMFGSQVIKIFSIKRIIERKYGLANEDIRRWSMRRVVLSSFLNSINSFLGSMSFIGFILIGSLMVMKKQLTFGSLFSASQMAGNLSWTFRSIGSYLTNIQASLAGADRLFEILDAPVEEETTVKDKEMEVNVQKTGTDVVFNNVTFSYDGENTVIDKLNLEVKKGEILAVVGSSGGGKSTLYKLLLRFYTPVSGSIYILGKPVESYNTSELRQLFAYVPQDSYLFCGTIGENIGYGKPGASMDDIIEAARAANAHDFIMEFPEGYDTEVGERGVRLSGGQKQRIAIARALLKDAPILLLDEATSSLDSESEDEVQKALNVLMKGRTTIVVAHRLSTIKNADRIIVLEDGNITEEGNHDSLMSLGNSYAHLYNLQFESLRD
jgi:ABC-type multidrug transport system, ATPase and permease components